MRSPVFLLAPDSFKGSLTAKEVCDAMETGIRKVLPDAECIKVPMADGGEGTVYSLINAVGGVIYEEEVTGPLGKPVKAKYGILKDNETAVIEMASASGLHLVDKNSMNPLIATTFGTGQLVRACLDKGIKKIILGIGGSATNDGGAGFMQALGVRLLDEDGNELPYGGEPLKDLYRIDVSSLDTRLQCVDIEVVSDVTNPLCGKEGASYVFGSQKGATPEMVEILDKSLLHYAEIIRTQLGKDIKDLPGAGAAGGLGAGLLAFTDAGLEKGVDTIINYTGLHEKIKKADFVFTGEGSIDCQTRYGKTPLGVARLAKKENKKVIAIAGSVREEIGQLYDLGFDAVFSIVPGPISLDDALADGKDNIEHTMENIIRILLMNQG